MTIDVYWGWHHLGDSWRFGRASHRRFASFVAAGVLSAVVPPPPPSHTFAAAVRHRLEIHRVERREAGRDQVYAAAPQNQEPQ